MGLKLEVDSLDSVAEAQRALYVEHEGKFRLDVDGGAVPFSALASERNDHKATKAKLSRYTVDGKEFDVEAARAGLAELDELRRKAAEKPDKGGKGDAGDSQRVRELSTQIEQLTQRLNAAEEKEKAAQTKLTRTKIETALDQAARDSGVLDQYRDDVRLRAGLFGLNPDEDDADHPVVMLDGKGEPVIENGKVVPPRLWLEGKMAKEKPGWFGTSSGGGARGGTTTIGGRVAVSRDDDAAFGANIEGIAKGAVAVR